MEEDVWEKVNLSDSTEQELWLQWNLNTFDKILFLLKF